MRSLTLITLLAALTVSGCNSNKNWVQTQADADGDGKTDLVEVSATTGSKLKVLVIPDYSSPKQRMPTTARGVAVSELSLPT